MIQLNILLLFLTTSNCKPKMCVKKIQDNFILFAQTANYFIARQKPRAIATQHTLSIANMGTDATRTKIQRRINRTSDQSPEQRQFFSLSLFYLFQIIKTSKSKYTIV